MSLKRSKASYSMLPDGEDFQHIPTATAKGADNYKAKGVDNYKAKGADNYKVPNVSQESEEKPPLLAWKRLQWLLNTFQTNGQNCDAHTAVEATFRGDDLIYSSHVQPQPYAMSGFTQRDAPTCPCCSVIKHTNNYY